MLKVRHPPFRWFSVFCFFCFPPQNNTCSEETLVQKAVLTNSCPRCHFEGFPFLDCPNVDTTTQWLISKGKPSAGIRRRVANKFCRAEYSCVKSGTMNLLSRTLSRPHVLLLRALFSLELLSRRFRSRLSHRIIISMQAFAGLSRRDLL